jgi:hypothetical protein
MPAAAATSHRVFNQESLCEEARHAAETTLTLQPNLGEAVLARGFYQCVSNQDPYTFNYRDVILADHPIIYWRLGETAGPFAYDESLNRRDATYIGSPSLGLPAQLPTTRPRLSNSMASTGMLNRIPILAFPACPILMGRICALVCLRSRLGSRRRKPPCRHLPHHLHRRSEVQLRFQVRYVYDRCDPKVIYCNVGDGT